MKFIGKHRESRRSARTALTTQIIVCVCASWAVGYTTASTGALSAAPKSWAGKLSARLLNYPEDAQDPIPSGDNGSDPSTDYREALKVLRQDAYGPAIGPKQARTLTYEAIRGLLAALHDPFTSFMDPDEWSQFHATTQGDFEGIGALLLPDGPWVKVSRPIETGPAEKVGVKADDVIIAVDHATIKGMDINDVVRRIKGRRGTKVAIDVLRGRQKMEFNIVRDLVEPPVVQHWMEDPAAGIGRIVLEEFNEKAIEQMRRAYADLERQGMKALIFDLRYNPGGLLDVAVQVTSLFIPPTQENSLNNVVVYIHDGNGRENGRELTDPEFQIRHVPTVLLVNDSSASASEIVTAAMKDYGVGTIMGQRTFGKGKVQTIYQLDDGSALRLTTQLYYPPRHEDINYKHDDEGDRIPDTGGVVPDIPVKQSPKWNADFRNKADDLQLQKAIEFLRGRLQGLTTAQATERVLQAPQR